MAVSPSSAASPYQANGSGGTRIIPEVRDTPHVQAAKAALEMAEPEKVEE